ncbi:DUF3883 domain-containing protein [Cloacibacterium sp. Arc13]|jgi:TusA-related sulfurtransferase|uniref:protein NO VEIN domain-containing protein n=1 Tax=unclassified Cloacibacterium TaxID=2620870 RepID=UPI00352CB69C
MSEKQFEDWLKNIYPSKSDSTIKDTLIFANNYLKGINRYIERNKLSSFFEQSTSDIDTFLNSMDKNTRFEKNEKTYLKRFVEFKNLDPNNYNVFDRKNNEKKAKRSEKQAIDDIKAFYEKKGYKVESVELKNCGWDLETTIGNIKLLLEVKGLNGKFYSINLSENEYNKLQENQENYRICIVSNCNSSAKNRHIKILKFENNEFFDENDKEDKISYKIIKSLKLTNKK